MFLRVISSPLFFDREVSMVEALFEAGLSCFHLRKPKADRAAYKGFLKQISVQFHPYIRLHQFPELCHEFNLGGYHLRSIDRTILSSDQLNALIGTLKGYKCILSTSIHHPDELTAYASKFDEFLLSPVLPSISKEGYMPTYEWKSSSVFDRSKIALGGIDVHTIQTVYERGFRSLACLGAIWNQPQHSLNKYLELCQKIRSLDPSY